MRYILLAIAMLLPTESNAKPFKDGCSFGVSKFYRQVTGHPPPYEHCCDDHDRAYARPGTADTRLRADNELAACVAQTHPLEASLIWIGIRVGGQPFNAFDWEQYPHDYATRWQYEKDKP